MFEINCKYGNLKFQLLVLFALVLSCQAVGARQVHPEVSTVSGRAVNEKGEPVAGATAALFVLPVKNPSLPDKAVLTDSEGRFVLKADNGRCLLRLLCMGRTARPVPLDIAGDTVVGDIVMKESVTAIAEVTVRPLVENYPDKVVYNIASDPERATSNMVQILDKVPLLSFSIDRTLQVDDGRSGGRTLVLRNGRPDPLFNGSGAPLYEVLARLTAMGFTRVEVLLDIPPRYEGYSHVVNIVADKKKALFGAVATLGGDYNYGNGSAVPSGMGVGNVGVTASADRLRIGAGGRYGGGTSPRTVRESRRTAGEEEIETSSTEKTFGEDVAAKVDVSYDLAERHFVSGGFSFGRASRDLTRGVVTDSRAAGTETSSTERRTDESLDRSFEGSVGYEFDFRKRGRLLTLNYDVSSRPLRRDQNIFGPTGGEYADEQRVRDLSHKASLYYGDAFKGNLSLDVTANYLSMDYRSSFAARSFDGGSWSDDASADFTQSRRLDRLYGRVNVGKRSRKLNLTASFSADWTLPGSQIELSRAEGTTIVDEHGLVMSGRLFASYMLPQRKKPQTSSPARPSPGGRIMGAYTVTSMRPTSQQLSSFEELRSDDYVVRGNPSLRNELYHAFSLIWRGPKVSFPSLNFRFSNNRIAKYWSMDDRGRLVESYRNGGRYRSFGLNSQNFFPLGKSMRLLLDYSASYTYDRVGEYLSHGWNCNIILSPSVRVWKEYLLAKVSGRYFGSWISGYNSWNMDPWSCSVSVSGRAALSESVAIDYGVSTYNLVRLTGRIDNAVDAGTFTYREVMRTRAVPVYFSVGLSLGKFKVKQPRAVRRGAELGGFSTGEAPR